MKVYLTQGVDGRILIQGRIEQNGILADLLHYLAQGETFMGVSFEQFSQATPGSMELPMPPEDVQPEVPEDGQAPEGEPAVDPNEASVDQPLGDTGQA